ncbi:hypothetical protein WMY93_002218 [Mugilogobius chulae]|uniref:Anion exchange protein n=1 Tax=Mugilogobius chulae TaxID=88201 RepID=A0AAW0Q3V8_9GOBI
MASGGHDVSISLQQVTAEEDVEVSGPDSDSDSDSDLDKALSVQTFTSFISDSAPQAEPTGRLYTDRDYENHRHSQLHTHHPLSTHLPPTDPGGGSTAPPEATGRRDAGKKPRCLLQTSRPPFSDSCALTLVSVMQEEDEEESDPNKDQTQDSMTEPEFSLGSQEELDQAAAINKYHTEDEERPLSAAEGETRSCGGDGTLKPEERDDTGSSPSDCLPSTSSGSSSVTLRRKPLYHRGAPLQRSNYDLRERTRIGSMTQETALYARVPTDEAEARLLASADLDHMKSHRFEDNPGLRRHLMKKSSRAQLSRTSTSSTPLSSLKKKKRAADKKTHELFVELNELIVEHNELRWKERARWIKFEEDVEEETGRWGKPHVASLSFRSLLELRRTISHGAVLLDLEQTKLPAIAHLVVETMIISDQIRAEDRANVLRALLRKHTHPSDLKPRFHRHHSSASLHGSFNHNHLGASSLPLVMEELETHHEKGPVYDPKQDVFTSLFTSLHPLPPEHHQASARSFKLMEKIPKDAEAVIVLVGCVDFLEQAAMAFVRLNEAVLFESMLEVPVPVRFLFFLLGPSQSSMDYHEIGRSFSTLMSDKSFHEVAYFADDRQDLLNGINEFLDCSIVLPPSDIEGKDLLKTVVGFQKQLLKKRKERELKKRHSVCGVEQENKEVAEEAEEEVDQEIDPLKRSGIPFGGLIHDIRRRYPHYMSDLRDSLDMQCIAAVIFIYFAALSPTITFGGLLGEKTEGMMGVTELIVSTATLGIIFSLLAGQPLLIIGFSGPLLVFEEAFYKFCQSQQFEYLTGRVWIGFWLIVIVLVIVAAEGSFMVRYISPFTQEIFAFLISLIFIYETFSKIFKVFREHPLLAVYPSDSPLPNDQDGPVFNQPNTALLSLVLMMGTFFVAFFLRKFRNSRFLGGKARRIIGDFGIPISILVSVLVDVSIPDTYTQKLNVPSGFSVTSPEKRGWFISPFGDKQPFPTWMMGASVVPALLVFILIFMETQITSLIVSKKERRLVKGSGFHLDLLLIVILGAVCPLFGLPWLTAATVRSVTHVNALTVMSKATAPGEKPMIQEVKEQRLTGMLVSVLVGLSIVMTDVLRLIPLAVLFGIFLYMGVTSLTGIQLYERITLMVTPAKHHPDHIYVTKVRTWRMNMFTIIQLACIIALWVVKSTVASLAFPFVLIMTVPLRRVVLSRIFNERELQALDCDEDSPNFAEDGRDEYNEIHMLV